MKSEMFKHSNAFLLIIIFLPLILIRCNSRNTSKIDSQEYKVAKVDDSQNIILDTKDFSGVIFKYTSNESSKFHSKGFTPTIEEVFKAERIFQQCLKVKKVGSDGMEIESRRIQHPSKYLRQYFGCYNEKGDKMIFLNCLSKEIKSTSDDWKNKQISTKDGGNNYFTILINITTQDCSYFMVNGSS